ncbi:MAG: cbb3-type cytochrome c oxidase subunit I [Armatimonadota bacterium]|nr:cbb3-type cytochrome c oxidase subunit I [Armatimonadota bacterium]
MQAVQVRGAVRFIILSELVIPFLLLILGVALGLYQVLARAGILRTPDFLGINYYQGLTLHGVINAVVFTTFFAVAFGNALMLHQLQRPLRTGVQWVSWVLMVGGTLMAAWAMLTGRATVLYTFYLPMVAHWTFYVGAALLLVGSLVPFFFDWLPSVVAWRRENPNARLPLAVLGILITFTLWFLIFLPLATTVVFQMIPLSLGLIKETNVLLSRTLFWFFGHALVYFWLLPSYIMLYVMLPKVAGGKLYSDPAARFAFLLFLFFSIPVGLHHQYTEGGLSAGWKLWHAFLTFMVALPSFITAFTVAASLEHSGRVNGGRGLFGWMAKLPYWDVRGDKWLFPYFIAGLILFLAGGITGIVNASYNLNLIVHNTAWVVGHFHTTVGGLVTLSFLGMTLYLLTKLRGVDLKAKPLAMAAPYLWMVGFLIFEVALSITGLQGVPRRSNLGISYLDPNNELLYRPDWLFWSHVGALGGVIAVLGFVSYMVSFFGTLFAKPVRQPAVEFPIAEAIHDQPTPFVLNLRPWVVATLLLIAVSYIYPLYEAVARGTLANVPGYQSIGNNLVPMQTLGEQTRLP